MSKDSEVDREALFHFVTYGYPGALPATRVSGQGRNNRPIQSPKTASWNVHIPHTEVIKLYYGFRPSCMEEKWAIHTVGPNEGGVGPGAFEIHMARSWTKYEIIVLKVEAEFEQGEQLKSGKDAKITGLTWEMREKDEDEGEADSKKVAMEICRYVLQCENLTDPEAKKE